MQLLQLEMKKRGVYRVHTYVFGSSFNSIVRHELQLGAIRVLYNHTT